MRVVIFGLLLMMSAAPSVSHAVEAAPAQPATAPSKEEMPPCSKIRTVTAEPESVGTALSNYRLKFEKIDETTFKIVGDELFYYIDLYKDDDGFHSLGFSISFEKIKVGSKEINGWNQEKRFSHAYMKDKIAVLEMDLNMEFGGMPDCQFQDNLYIWIDSKERFHDMIYKLK